MKKNWILFIIFIILICFEFCSEKSLEKMPDKETKVNIPSKSNPVVYFEIPVKDLDRAIQFYKHVFNFTFEKEMIDKNEMALFPFSETSSGISGALAKGKVYKPTKNGVILYFYSENIEKTLQLVNENGGKLLYPKTSNGELGFVAEFEDSEGNRIALHQKTVPSK
jgi:uncharacterized protein